MLGITSVTDFATKFMAELAGLEGRPYGSDLRHYLMGWNKDPGESVDCSSSVLHAYQACGGDITQVVCSDAAHEEGPAVAVLEILTTSDVPSSDHVRLAFYSRMNPDDSRLQYHVAAVLEDGQELGACDWAPAEMRRTTRAETTAAGWAFECERTLLPAGGSNPD